MTGTRSSTARAGPEPTLTDLGCCNVRVAIGGGTLAISLHGGRGGDRGTTTEWASLPSLLNTARQIILLSAAAD